MIDIMDNLTDYINNELIPYAMCVIDVFQGELESVMCRREPSKIPETEYLDGSCIGLFKFSMHAKSVDSKKAVAQLDSFIDDFKTKGQFDISPLLWVKIKPLTSARFISKTDKGEYIYSSDFELEYGKEGE